MGDRNPVPELTRAQRMAALDKAVRVRQDRAQCKENLRDGFITFKEFLNEPCVQRMRVEEALRAVPGIGKAKAARIRRELGVAPTRRVQGLGRRQREALLSLPGQA